MYPFSSDLKFNMMQFLGSAKVKKATFDLEKRNFFGSLKACKFHVSSLFENNFFLNFMNFPNL